MLTVTEGKFSISIDKEDIVDLLLKKRNEYEDYYYPIYSMPETENVKPLSKEEYEQNYDKIIDFVNNLSEENLKRIINDWPKKKNGTFNKRNVEYLFSCNNSEYICEWHNTWIYWTIKVISKNDKELEIIAYQLTDTPA